METVFVVGCAVLLAVSASAKTTDDESRKDQKVIIRVVTAEALGESVRTSTSPRVESSTVAVRALDQSISIRLNDVSLQTYFEEMSRQSKLKFLLTEGLADCRVSAFQNATVREALQAILSVKGMTYQQLGHIDTYTITSRLTIKPICPPRQSARSVGKCVSKDNPISIECRKGALSDFAEILHDQSGTDLFVWNDAVSYPIDIKIEKVDIDKALDEVQQNKALLVDRDGTRKKFAVFARVSEKDADESPGIYISSRVVQITPTGTVDFIK